MDIKDELDAMLNNLQSGSNSSKPVKKAAVPVKPEKTRTEKKVDSMSVDDIINALSAPPKKAEPPKPASTNTGSIPANLLNMLDSASAGSHRSAAMPRQNVPHKPAAKKADAVSENTKQSEFSSVQFQDLNKLIDSNNKSVSRPQPQASVQQPKQKTEENLFFKSTHQFPVPDEKIIKEVKTLESQKAEEEKAAEPEVKKHKKIVINHELPDYDALMNENDNSQTSEQTAADDFTNDPLSEYDNSADNAVTELENEEISSISEEEQKESSHSEKGGIFKKFRKIFDKSSESDDSYDDEDKEEPENSDEIETEDYSDENNSADEVKNTEEYTLEELETLTTNELIDAVLGEDNGITNTKSSEEKLSESNVDETESTLNIDEVQKSDEEFSSEIVPAIDEPLIDETAESGESPENTEIAEDVKVIEQNDNSAENSNINIDVEPSAKKKGRIISALENILDESPKELEDAKVQDVEDDDIDVSISNKSKFKKHLYAILGIVLFGFAIIGFTFSVGEGIKRVRSFTAGEDKKDGFIDTVYPAVIMDIDSFESPSELASDRIITAAIWSLILSDDIDNYEQNLDMVSVPAVDIEKYAANLFGSDIPEIEHQTVGSGDVKFYYNADTKSYNIPVNPIVFSYYPDITSVSKNGDIYSVEVEYIQDKPSWMIYEKNAGREVSKVAKYKLKKSDSGYMINSVEITSINSIN